MKVNGHSYRTLWVNADGWSIEIIDQTRLPFVFETITLRQMEDAARAISDMQVRGAPLIGATAAYGLCLQMRNDPNDAALDRAVEVLMATRPTAVNLRWALQRMSKGLKPVPPARRCGEAYRLAALICDEDVAINASIGRHGLKLIQAVAASKPAGASVNILTHCNAGWLATVDWGTATAPIYMAHDSGLKIHVWVDETRPRNQGAALTAWELAHHGVPHTVIVDNAGGHLMQHGQVDLCLTGTDRTTAAGDVCNKIGTYLKALAARDNGIPFYVALPSPTIDFSIENGLEEIPIEERNGIEVSRMTGRAADGTIGVFDILAEGSPVANPAFDVTPARLVTALITERGVAPASREGLMQLFKDEDETAAATTGAKLARSAG